MQISFIPVIFNITTPILCFMILWQGFKLDMQILYTKTQLNVIEISVSLFRSCEINILKLERKKLLLCYLDQMCCTTGLNLLDPGSPLSLSWETLVRMTSWSEHGHGVWLDAPELHKDQWPAQDKHANSHGDTAMEMALQCMLSVT